MIFLAFFENESKLSGSMLKAAEGTKQIEDPLIFSFVVQAVALWF